MSVFPYCQVIINNYFYSNYNFYQKSCVFKYLLKFPKKNKEWQSSRRIRRKR